MLDLAGILFSSIMMFIVILRAVQLDRTKPWFEGPKASTPPVSDTPKARIRTGHGEADGRLGGR